MDLLIPDPPPPPIPPGAPVSVDGVTVLPDDPDWDLEVAVTISGVSLTITAALQLSADGTELVISTNLPGVGTTLPFNVLSGLAGPPATDQGGLGRTKATQPSCSSPTSI